MDKITGMKKIYLIDSNEYNKGVVGTKFEEVDVTELSDKDFIVHADHYGYTLEEFEELFNNNPHYINPDKYYIRFITEEDSYNDFWKARYEHQKELTESKEQELNDLKEDAKNTIAKVRELANKHNLWKL
jgi:hypothetical protein